MKNILLPILFICFFLQIGNTQIFNCSENNFGHFVEVGIPSCENNGDGDFIAVTFSVSGFSGCSGQVTILDLPDDVSVNGYSLNTPNYYWIQQDGDFDFSIPSDECVPVNYSLSFITACLQGGQGNCVYPNLILAIPPTIPTLGQWGLIFLSLVSMVFGVLYLRKRIIQEALK
jgi:hypothetical protein